MNYRLFFKYIMIFRAKFVVNVESRVNSLDPIDKLVDFARPFRRTTAS